jgi:hypothetical protein
MSHIDPEAGRETADAVEPGLDLLAIPRVAVREPVVLILLLAGFFDGISGNPVHATVLATAAIALSVDAARDRSMVAPGWGAGVDLAFGRRRVLWPALAAIAIGYAIVAGGFERYSWPGTIAVILPASIVLVVSWRGPLPGAPTPMRPSVRGSVLWAAVFITMGLWELTMLLMQPTLKTDSWAHPTLSTLMDPVLVSHPGRTISLCVWAALGWFLVLR